VINWLKRRDGDFLSRLLLAASLIGLLLQKSLQPCLSGSRAWVVQVIVVFARTWVRQRTFLNSIRLDTIHLAILVLWVPLSNLLCRRFFDMLGINNSIDFEGSLIYYDHGFRSLLSHDTWSHLVLLSLANICNLVSQHSRERLAVVYEGGPFPLKLPLHFELRGRLFVITFGIVSDDSILRTRRLCFDKRGPILLSELPFSNPQICIIIWITAANRQPLHDRDFIQFLDRFLEDSRRVSLIYLYKPSCHYLFVASGHSHNPHRSQNTLM